VLLGAPWDALRDNAPRDNAPRVIPKVIPPAWCEGNEI